MAYDTLKTEIRQYIQTNGQQEITGQILQNVLLDMVNAYPSLDGYATQQWVSNQLNDMATQQWVGNNYLPLGGGTITGNLNVNGTLKIAINNSLSFGSNSEIFRLSQTSILVMKNDDQDIVLGSLGNNYYVDFIEDVQGGTANSDYTMNTFNWGITTAGAATFVSVTQTSDIRRKNIISNIGMDIDDIAKAPMFRFTMKDDDKAIVRVGTSAQYWQTVIPEVVSEDKRGVLGMQYDVAAMAGVITVAKRVVDHEDRISAIERKLNIN